MTIDWIAEHWEVCSVIGALILRELTKNMAKQTAAKMIEHFLSPQERMIRDIKRNLQLTMDHMGIEGQWSGEGPIFGHKARRSLTRLLTGFSRVTLRRTFKLKRRKKKMSNINWTTLVVALLGALKLILQPFGIEIEDEHINAIANGVAALLTVIGVVMSHRKEGGASNGTTQYPGDHGPAV